jgi:Tfp pilus assembly protein PilV
LRGFRAAGFVLVEVMLGVAIFSVGVLALGQCVNNCVQAEAAKNEDRIARIALENRLAEIKAGAVDLSRNGEEPLKGMFNGITLKQQIKPISMQNENKQMLMNLFEVDLEAVWKSSAGGSGDQSKALSVYVQRP